MIQVRKIVLVLCLFLSVTVPAGPSSETEAATICTDPKCYGLPSNAEAEQIENMCYAILSDRCREVDVKYTQCYVSRGGVLDIGENPPKDIWEIIERIPGPKAVGGCLAGAGSALYATLQGLKSTWDFVTDPDAGFEAIDTMSYLAHQFYYLETRSVLIKAMKENVEKTAVREWGNFFSCLNAAGKTRYSCKALIFVIEAFLGSKGAGKLVKSRFVKMKKRSAANQSLQKKLSQLPEGERLKFSDLTPDEIKVVNSYYFRSMDMSTLTDETLARMPATKGKNKLEVTFLLDRLPPEEVAKIDLKKAPTILKLVEDRRYVSLIKSNIANGREMPFMEDGYRPSVLKEFDPEEIPKLNGLGKGKIRSNWWAKEPPLSVEQARNMTPQQARDLVDNVVKQELHEVGDTGGDFIGGAVVGKVTNSPVLGALVASGSSGNRHAGKWQHILQIAEQIIMSDKLNGMGK